MPLTYVFEKARTNFSKESDLCANPIILVVAISIVVNNVYAILNLI